MPTAWRITGTEIGPDGNGAAFYAKRTQAEAALAEYRNDRNESRFDDGGASGPDIVYVTTAKELADALNDAMGYGAS